MRPQTMDTQSLMREDRERRHPYRLPEDFYGLLDQVFFISVRVKGVIRLTEPPLPETTLTVMGRVARRTKTRLHAYVLMPDHFHVLVSVIESGGDVARWLRYTKREIARASEAPGMWQRSWWDRYARDAQDLKTRLDYLLNNPVRKGLCASWTDWPYAWSEWPPHGAGRDPNLPSGK